MSISMAKRASLIPEFKKKLAITGKQDNATIDHQTDGSNPLSNRENLNISLEEIDGDVHQTDGSSLEGSCGKDENLDMTINVDHEPVISEGINLFQNAVHARNVILTSIRHRNNVTNVS